MANPIPITGLTNGTVKATDLYPAVDVTDTTQATTGTTKNYSIAQLSNFISANPGQPWVNQTTSINPVAQLKYFANSSLLLTFTLPATAPQGYQFKIVGVGTGGWTIAQNAGQNILLGNRSSTVGAGGSVSSNQYTDTIDLVCTVANTTWQLANAPQSLGLTIV